MLTINILMMNDNRMKAIYHMKMEANTEEHAGIC